MLTASEAESVYEKLQGILRKVGLSRVADEVTAEVRLGKVEAKKVRVSEREGPADYLLPVTQRARTKTETFTGSVEFTPFEKLNTLLRAIERSTIELAEMHREISERLSRILPVAQGMTISEIVFVDEERGQTLVSNLEVRTKLLEACRALEPLVIELREQLHAASR